MIQRVMVRKLEVLEHQKMTTVMSKRKRTMGERIEKLEMRRKSQESHQKCNEKCGYTGDFEENGKTYSLREIESLCLLNIVWVYVDTNSTLNGLWQLAKYGNSHVNSLLCLS